MDTGYHQTITGVTFPYNEYVLVLPGWYPTWLDPYPGDFNQRQVLAASIYMPQVVLYIGKDNTGTIKKQEVRIQRPTERVLEIIVVYPKGSVGLTDPIYSNLVFLRLLWKYSNQIKKKFGKPCLLHSYIVIRGGLAGWLLSKKWKLPFILTEHWTIYDPADPGFLAKRNVVFRSSVKTILRSVKRFLPVSSKLAEQASQLVGNVPFTVIPNVVDTRIFKADDCNDNEEPFVFIHISTMVEQKDPEGLLRAFKKFDEKFPGTQLQMVGPAPEHVLKYAKQLDLRENKVIFTGPVTYEAVAGLLTKSNVLVLFSRYENLPCVILESLCCGVPVISTDVGGIAEVVNDANGVLVPTGNEQQLLEAMIQVYTCYNNYQKKEIAAAAVSAFSYEAIGKKISEVYEQVCDEENLSL